MKHLITWLTLGIILLLFGCQDCQRQQAQLDNDTLRSPPVINYCSDLDLFYNEGFVFDHEEDIRIFTAKIKGQRLAKTRLGGETLCRALRLAAQPGDSLDWQHSRTLLAKALIGDTFSIGEVLSSISTSIQ